ncbi:hypothetical protein BH09MYX1_BH09MYX1_04360 [soil metagenome]
MKRMAFAASAALFMGLLGVAACGGQVDDGGGTTDDDAGPQGRNPNGKNDSGNGYVDPQCPNKKPPGTYKECDVPTQSGCGPGEGCFPAVLPPNEKCEPETYATLCIPAGPAKQGEACNGHANCAAGYICLITGGDTQCAHMCDIKQKNQCPSGYVCEPIDVPGYAACL